MLLSPHINKRVFFTTIVAIFSYLHISSSQAHAQTTSLAIWPPLLEATIQPGKTITQVYRLKNLGDDTTITAQVIPFSPADELGHVLLKTVGTVPTVYFFSLQNADLNKSLPATFKLKGGQTQELVLKVRIPEDQSEADHYFTFLFSSNTIGLVGGSGATTQASIGSNILLTISNDGQPQRSAKIEEFKTNKFIDSFSSISFLLRVKNTGTTRFKSIGQVEIKNTFKKTIATLPIREDNVLAGSIRSLTSEITPGVKEVHTPGVQWHPIFPLGHYTATATITPQDSNLPISQTISFLVLPYKALLIILLIFTLTKALTKIKKSK
jgi:hypothetical protein